MIQMTTNSSYRSKAFQDQRKSAQDGEQADQRVQSERFDACVWIPQGQPQIEQRREREQAPDEDAQSWPPGLAEQPRIHACGDDDGHDQAPTQHHRHSLSVGTRD